MAHSPIKKVGPRYRDGTMGVSHLFIRNILKEATTNDPEPIESAVAHRGEEVPQRPPFFVFQSVSTLKRFMEVVLRKTWELRSARWTKVKMDAARPTTMAIPAD